DVDKEMLQETAPRMVAQERGFDDFMGYFVKNPTLGLLLLVGRQHTALAGVTRSSPQPQGGQFENTRLDLQMVLLLSKNRGGSPTIKRFKRGPGAAGLPCCTQLLGQQLPVLTRRNPPDISRNLTG
ncbi:Hypothetical predicted protein, partial [Marmota monax]